ncbi:Phosphoglycerate mutase [Spirochaeta thermophila DSM 6578]|uniref:Phosphoglycerate mutase n=1 Tax=Winmispira thermophila (strain ATCC 700085 / DSM 6578 / Z-1203) TaxID=869211 RepID=G0GC06_WINT7|nr:histidine phosphatase family protein [Spirochaeta thermophila]AEJ62017.1 Phosphoglycerate mutase [Spirochaeta thermophila DSM 6578]
MTSPLRVYLVRHAACSTRGFIGITDPPLSEEGLRQREALARFFAPLRLETVYTSPLARAQATAEVLGTPEEVEALREIDFGQWEGKLHEEIPREALEAWYQNPHTTSPPGGETLVRLAQRVLPAFKEIVSRHGPGGRIALVSHGGPLRVIICSVLGLHLAYLWHFDLDRASVSAVDVYPTGYTSLAFLNHTFHLEEPAR